MKRIVRSDNFGMSGESPGKDEAFILWPLSDEIAEQIAGLLVDDGGEMGDFFYRAEPEDYELLIFEP